MQTLCIIIAVWIFTSILFATIWTLIPRHKAPSPAKRRYNTVITWREK